MSVSKAAMIEFVDLREEHLEEVLAIEPEAYPEPWTLGMFRREIRSPESYFCVAFLDDVLVGYGGFWLVLDEVHITSVTVRHQYRRRGLGRRLVMHLLRVAADADARQVMLEVRGTNYPARVLYESLGFKATGFHKAYYQKTNEDAIIMTKELGPRRSVADLYEEI